MVGGEWPTLAPSDRIKKLARANIEISFMNTTNHMGGEDFQKCSKKFFG